MERSTKTVYPPALAPSSISVSCLALHHGRRFSEGPIHVRRDRGYLIFQTRGPPGRARRVCRMALGRAGSWDVVIIKRFVWSFSAPFLFFFLFGYGCAVGLGGTYGEVRDSCVVVLCEGVVRGVYEFELVGRVVVGRRG